MARTGRSFRARPLIQPFILEFAHSVSISQVAATITATGGTQATNIGIAQVAATLTLTGNEPYKTAILADSPQLYWRLGETSGTTAQDASGNGHTGTYTQTIAGGYTLNQTGLLVNDSDPAVKITRANGGHIQGAGVLTGQTAARSFEAWIKGTDYSQVFSSNRGIMGDQNNAVNTTGWYFYNYSNFFVFGCHDTALGFNSAVQSLAASVPSTASSAHVVGTWDGLKTFKIYINGVLSNTAVTTQNVVPNASTTPFSAGYSTVNGANYWDGVVDEVAVYTSALTAAQVLNHYNVGITNPIITTVNIVSITQVAASITFAGGAQAVAAVQSVSITQVAATITFTGGTQAVGAQVAISISQVAATVTFTGGTQAVATVNIVSLTQLAATITFTGNPQGVQNVQDAQINQVATTVTFTGGTQTVVGANKISITQLAASLTLTGGTQAVLATRMISISQSAATITFAGGTQVAGQTALIAQLATNLGINGGTQTVKTTNIIAWVSPSIILDSGAKSSTVYGGQKFTTALSGANISDVTSGTKNETIQSGSKTTTVQSGANTKAL